MSHPHESARSSQKSFEDRLRQQGASPEFAKKIAEKASRELHEKLDKRR